MKSQRLYRPVVDLKVDNDDVTARVSNYVLAPSLCGFVLWTLNEAVKSGKKRLYFLARDGYLMYQSAKIFCKKLDLPIECRYLSCSRYSIRVPLFHLDTDDALEYVCRSGIDVNMKKILNRAGLTDQEQVEVLDGIELNIDKSEVIPYARLGEIRHVLKESERFMEYMCRHSKEAMPNLIGYLHQEGLLDKVDVALVDSGWVGSMQKTLNQLLAYVGQDKGLEGYYWGLYELPAGAERGTYHCYYFGPEGGLKEKVYFSNCLFEVIFSAPHGMTLRYEEEGRGLVPVYDYIADVRRIFIEEIECLLAQYTQQLANGLDSLATVDFQGDRRTIKALISLFMGKPTQMEAKTYGECMFSDDVLESDMQPVAAVMNEKDLKDNHVMNKVLIMFGLKKGNIRESAWYEGSAARNGQAVGWHLWQYALYKYLLYVRKTILWRRING